MRLIIAAALIFAGVISADAEEKPWPQMNGYERLAKIEKYIADHGLACDTSKKIDGHEIPSTSATQAAQLDHVWITESMAIGGLYLFCKKAEPVVAAKKIEATKKVAAVKKTSPVAAQATSHSDAPASDDEEAAGDMADEQEAAEMANLKDCLTAAFEALSNTIQVQKRFPSQKDIDSSFFYSKFMQSAAN